MSRIARFDPTNEDSIKQDDAPIVEQKIVSGKPTQNPKRAPERKLRKMVPGIQNDCSLGA